MLLKKKFQRNIEYGKTHFTFLYFIGEKQIITTPNRLITYINMERNYCKLLYHWKQISVTGFKKNDGFRFIDLSKRSYVLNHLHGRCVVGKFERGFHKVIVWWGQRAVILINMHKSKFIQFINNFIYHWRRHIFGNDM